MRSSQAEDQSAAGEGKGLCRCRGASCQGACAVPWSHPFFRGLHLRSSAPTGALSSAICALSASRCCGVALYGRLTVCPWLNTVVSALIPVLFSHGCCVQVTCRACCGLFC